VFAGTAAAIVAILYGLHRSLVLAKWPPSDRARTFRTSAVILLGWLAVSVALGALGVYHAESTEIPTIQYSILLPIVILPPVGFFLGSMAPRSYETRMSVLIQDPAKFNPFLEDLSVKTNLKERMEGLRALLMSRHVLAQVAEDLQMIPPDATETQQSGAVAELAAGLSVTLLGQEMVEMRYRARTPDGHHASKLNARSAYRSSITTRGRSLQSANAPTKHGCTPTWTNRPPGSSTRAASRSTAG